MDKNTLLLGMAFGGAMAALGLFYAIFGVFYFTSGGKHNQAARRVIYGGWARIFGIAYIILGLPLFAYSYGASQAPNASWYQWIHQYIHSGNYQQWLIGWAIAAIAIHIFAFMVPAEREKY